MTYSGPGCWKIGDHEVERDQQQPDQRQRIDPDRRLAPLDALGVAQEDADRRADDHDLPGAEDEPRQLVVEHRPQRQARHDPVQHAEKRVGDEAVGDRVGVHHAPAARREQLDAAQRIVIDELQRHQQPGQQRDREIRQRGQEVPAHQPFHHERLGRRDAWAQEFAPS